MIKKIYNLTLNEVIKQYKKKSIVIITLLIFLSAIAMPFIINAIESHTTDWGTQTYTYEIQGIDAQIASTKDTTADGKINLKFLKSEKAYNQMLLKENISLGSWQYTSANSYFNIITQIDIIELLQDGYSKDEISKFIPPNSISKDTDTILNMSKANYNKTLEVLKSKANEIEKNIKSNNYTAYLNSLIKVKKQTIELYSVSLTALKASKEKDVISKVNVLESQINSEKQLLNVLEYRLNNKIPFNTNNHFGKENWKSNTLNDITLNIQESSNNTLVSKDAYMKKNTTKVTYDQYVTKYKNAQKIYADNIAKDWYSLKTNAPRPQFVSSARSTVNSLITTYVIIASFIVVIIAGGIVSSEFTKNTIKLLMIRPVSRFKVLLSKLLAVLVIGYFILFVSLALSTIASGIAFGFSDLAIPTIKMSGASVISQNYILSLILNILFYSISMIFIGTVAFTLSTITKSTAVSVAVSIIIFVGSFPLTLYLLTKNYTWLAFTPIPYINLTAVSMLDSFKKIFGSVVVLNSTIGAITLIIATIILLIIALVYFMKTDIKS